MRSEADEVRLFCDLLCRSGNTRLISAARIDLEGLIAQLSDPPPITETTHVCYLERAFREQAELDRIFQKKPSE